MKRRTLLILGAGTALYGTNGMAFKLGGLTGGGNSTDDIKRLLTAAAKADAKMHYHFSIALGKKDDAQRYNGIAESLTVDTVEDDYEKLNELKDETPLTENELGAFQPSEEANAALAAGNAMGSIALINYTLVLPKIKSGIDSIKSNPLNFGLAQTLMLATQAIPKAMTTLTAMITTSNKMAASNSIPLKSKDEVAQLSKDMGGTVDTSALP